MRFNALKTEICSKKRVVPLFMCLYIKKPTAQSLRSRSSDEKQIVSIPHKNYLNTKTLPAAKVRKFYFMTKFSSKISVFCKVHLAKL